MHWNAILVVFHCHEEALNSAGVHWPEKVAVTFVQLLAGAETASCWVGAIL